MRWRAKANRYGPSLIHQNNVLDLRDITIPPGDEVARQAEATVPPVVSLADIEGDKHVVWRLEVWGAGPGMGQLRPPVRD
jgi:hypothetical protein